ncbi:MAG TPA: GSCFA domain-containing protein [Bacteroidales bacterium]|nr:GSCFA domain-containing protein [Bacteroidales bacterium]
MELRTIINTGKSEARISYSDPVLFLGSCFASEMGAKLEEGKMPVLINPTGTVYNPVSVINTLELIVTGRKLSKDDLYCHEGTWLSFSHYTDFSSDDPARVLEKINSNSVTAHSFLKQAHFLFITFGTARVFRLNDSGIIVSNCHKLPSAFFSRELLTVRDIVELWNKQLDMISSEFPGLKTIFTISPVRHWKDGAHGNQVSKSVLFLAVEELLSHHSAPGYFPAYEIVMDELRDYRFYDQDMLHPSGVAVDYIWEKFTGTYFDESTMAIWKEASGITRAMKHRISSERSEANRRFAENILSRISGIESYAKGIDFSEEKKYFRDLLK